MSNTDNCDTASIKDVEIGNNVKIIHRRIYTNVN